MRAVVQRVSRAQVTVEDQVVGKISHGFLVLLGVDVHDTEHDAEYIAEKISGLRVFADVEDKMNLSLADVAGSVLVVSQFTLHGDCRRGRRPSYSDAARPELAIPLYDKFVSELRDRGHTVETGIFGAMMQVELVNDGPVTLLLDSNKLF
ncbi:MAG: D-tyrosyl-tRNA(Tyr) deacylase [Bacillota bacterium]|nr:MAG: D-tyrosyl-tRNA(Tyr) deacylase [Bacillota bacterium]MBS3949295.1 D-tyrosyl-tRNA(Tyr) deacylase [Peptococcaceae bacterium]